VEKITVVIPFFRRHDNLRKCLEGLVRQDEQDFEVVVASFEPDEELERICRRYVFTRIEEVPGAEWNVARSRNTGIRAARGEFLVFLDVDIVARPQLLSLHWAEHARAPEVCITAGRVLGFYPYGHPMEPEAEALLRAEVPVLLAGAEACLPSDPRWGREHGCPLPWAFCWSGNLSVPRRHALEHGLLFDETFQGWGGEDLEWAYRAQRSGCQVVLCQDAWGVHLPHPRHIEAIVASERRNFRRFIRRHPCLEVELLVWLNDLEANRLFTQLVDEITHARGASPDDPTRPLCLAVREGRLRLGVDVLEADEQAFSLLGVATPFEDGAFQEVQLAPWMRRLPAVLLDAIEAEVVRLRGRA
jgi:glycosyltransferase involved in cell wall biosynthesis